MSSSVYYLFGTDGTVYKRFEARNGWGSCPVIWEYLCKKYISPTSMWMMDVAQFWKDKTIKPRMSPGDRFLFDMTCDRTLTPRAEFERAATLLETIPVDPKVVNHWPEIVKMLREHAADENVLGLGIYATSVSEDQWVVWNEEKEESEVVDPRTAEQVVYG